MGRIVFTLLFSIFLASCTGSNKSPILVPELSQEFYESAISELNDELKKNPENEELVEQKLYYCELLNWPTTCESTLDSYRSLNGMTFQLVERYIAYYERHERYQLLLATIEDWNEKYQLEEKFIETYINSLAKANRSRETVVALREYLKTRDTKEDLAFAAKQYLTISNKPLSLLTLNKLYDKEPSHPMMLKYGEMLFDIGQIQKGREVLEAYRSETNHTSESGFYYANLLSKAGLYQNARQVLPFDLTVDSVAFLYSELYEKDRLFDSAAYVLEAYMRVDSTDSRTIWRLGLVQEQRGWLSTALSYFRLFVEQHPEDTLAVQKLEEVQRKIAYLQRQKAVEEQLPVLELKPKTIKNE